MATPTSYLDYDAVYATIVLTETDGTPSTRLASLIKQSIQDGYADFLNSYEWSFMRPVVSTALSAGDESLDMPDDYGTLIGGVTISHNEQEKYELTQVPPEDLVEYQKQAQSIPRYFSMEPKSTSSPTLGQLWTMRLWPLVNQNDLTIVYRYRRAIDIIDTGDTFLGGPVHSQTLLSAGYAKFEQYYGRVSGTRTKDYEDKLLLSQKLDDESSVGWTRSTIPYAPTRHLPHVHSAVTVTFS